MFPIEIFSISSYVNGGGGGRYTGILRRGGIHYIILGNTGVPEFRSTGALDIELLVANIIQEVHLG